MVRRAEPTTWRAPAKLNLFLHVVGRRPDGYHLIQSVMQRIDLCDTLTVTPTDDGRIVRTRDVPGVAEDNDLSIRAARLLQSSAGTTRGATIAVEKVIPIGGGLGGGSSDAATVLVALDHLWDLRWAPERLAALGLTLGADVPFFIGGTDAFVEGIGERLTPIALPRTCFVVVHPGIAVPTAAIFGDPELTRDTEALKISDFSEVATGGISLARPSVDRAASEHFGRYRNDLEAVAARRFEPVGAALRWLGFDHAAGTDWSGAAGTARMSGSGACLFRPFVDRASAESCLRALPRPWTGWVAEGLGPRTRKE